MDEISGLLQVYALISIKNKSSCGENGRKHGPKRLVLRIVSLVAPRLRTTPNSNSTSPNLRWPSRIREVSILHLPQTAPRPKRPCQALLKILEVGGNHLWLATPAGSHERERDISFHRQEQTMRINGTDITDRSYHIHIIVYIIMIL